MHLLHHSGNATRSCGSDGQWGEVNVLNCTSPEFVELEQILVSTINSLTVKGMLKYYLIMKANKSLTDLEPEVQVEEAASVTQRLIEATMPQNKSLLPNDLGASARILTAVVNVLERNDAINEVSIFMHAS